MGVNYATLVTLVEQVTRAATVGGGQDAHPTRGQLVTLCGILAFKMSTPVLSWVCVRLVVL